MLWMVLPMKRRALGIVESAGKPRKSAQLPSEQPQAISWNRATKIPLMELIR